MANQKGVPGERDECHNENDIQCSEGPYVHGLVNFRQNSPHNNTGEYPPYHFECE